MGFRSGIPRNLPLPPQPVLQAYFIIYTSGKWESWVGTWSTPDSRCHCGLLGGAGHLLDALVDCLLAHHHGISWESVFKAGLECSPVDSREVGAVW
jgi:hypothetical protein